jgi:DNA-binding MarR family transcriptional regulator/N-acetylglutamate synthase-like GNAT family acetyltransferase
MNFFDKAGKKAIGTRLRRLSERITDDAAKVYALYGADFHPKWFPVFYVLSEGQEKTITGIAEEIGHSHPSVSKIVTEMTAQGFISECKDSGDRRRNVVRLSPKGLQTVAKMEHQYIDVNAVIEDVLAQTTHDLWKAIGEWEFLLDQHSLYERVREQRKKRESEQVDIVAYTPEFQSAFRELNVEWISKFFKMEAADYKALDHPQEYILDKGGHILVAIYGGEPVGVCALIKMDNHDFDYELAKMAVSPKAQGKSIGYSLGKAVLEKAKLLGARSVFLESNTKLKPAISLYHKLGFQKVSGYESPYERADIQMAVHIQ